jgi:tetratricopeptide (TPR) repeat protein
MWRALMSAFHRDAPASTLELAERYTKSFPGRNEGWIVLADGLVNTTRFAAARRALRRAMHVTPTALQWYVATQFGHLYREKRDERRAERWYRKALRAHPGTTTHVFLGAVLARQGRFADAKRNYRRAIELATDDGGDSADEAYYNLGLVLRAERNYREAAVCFKKALILDSRHKIARDALQDVTDAMRLCRTRRLPS